LTAIGDELARSGFSAGGLPPVLPESQVGFLAVAGPRRRAAAGAGRQCAPTHTFGWGFLFWLKLKLRS